MNIERTQGAAEGRGVVRVEASPPTVRVSGVPHSDLTPSNVLISAMGPKVIDFGMAHTTELTTISGGHLRLGQRRPPRGTGRLPFGQGPTDVLLYRALHTRPCLEGLDDELRVLVEEAMRKDPTSGPARRTCSYASSVIQQETGCSCRAVRARPGD
ncbi:hypothetical protein [Frankia sp. CIT1]|uniref:hypothetical protein n=1 Tax=Frankia sp. CIT1 TaxID=2880974 RepID=UPI001EF67B92|nr:hypothetical protein [Frankia sp. CIT1]